MKKEIGGYLELECASNPQYHKNAVLLNSGRNALRYIIKALGIKKLHTPYYTCPVIWESIQEENCEIIPYDIDNNFMPTKDFNSNDFILYNNFFGICGKNVTELEKKYPNLIIDNAQSFYSPKKGTGCIYSPRKFFGLPDGGLALCDAKYNDTLQDFVSYNICSHLLKRYDLGSTAGYKDFQENDAFLKNQPVCNMSKLTRALMGNIEYERIKEKRLQNFTFLHSELKDKNKINISLDATDVPMVYPFYTEDKTLRNYLIENKIFVARYWPIQEGCDCMTSKNAQTMADCIIPIPTDQRYNIQDMKRILEVLCK